MPRAAPWTTSCRKRFIVLLFPSQNDRGRPPPDAVDAVVRSEALLLGPVPRSFGFCEVGEALLDPVLTDGVHATRETDDLVAVAQVDVTGASPVVDLEVLQRLEHALTGEILVVTGLLEAGDREI